jgi:AcrR family transcriptional regulator
MQQEKARRTNPERSEATRAVLVAAARRLFTENGYAETGTPEIVAAAGVTRGALYHHFADKQALFAEVVEREAAAVAAQVERAAPLSDDLIGMMQAGGRAYLTAMRAPGRARLLLVDGPAVLGRKAMDAVHDRHGSRTLRQGLAAAMDAGAFARLPVDALTTQVGAMFDAAVLAIDSGADADDQAAVLSALFAGLAARSSGT